MHLNQKHQVAKRLFATVGILVAVGVGLFLRRENERHVESDAASDAWADAGEDAESPAADARNFW
jgi:hypothetical protein